MRIRTKRIFFAAAIGLLLTTGLHAQDMSEREDLADALNDAMGNLMMLISANPYEPHSTPVILPTGISIKGYNGECTEPIDADLEYEPDPGPEISDHIRLVVTLREPDEMDIPELSHDLACQLNVMIWQLFNGNLQDNVIEDENGVKIPQPWNFDVNCASASTQQFWMIDEDEEYGSGNEMMKPEVKALMWRPEEGSIYDTRLWDIGGSEETDGQMFGRNFVEHENDGANVWIVRRHATPGWFEAKRANSVVVFDYNFYETYGGITPSTDFDYIHVDPASNPWGYTKKLRSIVLQALPHEYSTDDCPQGNTVVQPLSDRAELKMTLFWDDASASGTNACVQSWSTNPDDDNQSLWERMDGNNAFNESGLSWGAFDVDENGVLYFETTTNCSGTPERYGLIKVRDRAIHADRCEMALDIYGTFSIDDMTGELIYTTPSITDQIFCFEFCETLSGYLTFDNVISASAQTFASEWDYDETAHGTWNPGNDGGSPLYDPGDAVDPYIGMPDNDFQTSERGQWRPDRAYVYRSDIKSGVGVNRVYEAAGVFTDENGDAADAFQLFNWRDPSNNRDNWLNPVVITKYAPSGESVEERDILEIPGTAKLAHAETVPRLVAQNATYDAVDFESFEDRTDDPQLDEEIAHSGEVSYRLETGGSYSDELASVTLTPQIAGKGLLIKLWVQQTYNTTPVAGVPPICIKVGGQTFCTLAPENANTLEPALIHWVAQTGEWSLYQLVIKNFGSELLGNVLPVTVKNNIATLDEVWVDDIRAQPLDAEMTCFVYDRHTLRLIGQFDDQHFGVYSRYNGEGNVVSVLRETERGTVTVTESQSWVMTQPRYTAGGGSSISGSGGSSSSNWADRVGSDLPSSVRTGRGTEFDIASLRIGPQGPTVDLFGGRTMPLNDLQDLLDFSADFPGIKTDNLAALLPELPEAERLAYVRELMKLDADRAELENDLKNVADAKKREELQRGLDAIDAGRDEILRGKLGLTDEEIKTLYDELRTESESEAEEEASND